LKENIKGIKIIAVEPIKSPVLSGGKAGAHNIQGLGSGFIPEIYNPECIDEVKKVQDDDDFRLTKEIAVKEGILLGISSGAAIFAALEEAKKLGNGKNVLAIAPDGGEKYISMGIYD
ncbi:pyridoxal-phosphate dependent enzyme, partial [Clostridium perfringens]|uniref:pyridoxal-phosphate dependent enzyme n=1 Tax=Clostridium perfringens TaxID=1502 RepID=UPI002AC50BE8